MSSWFAMVLVITTIHSGNEVSHEKEIGRFKSVSECERFEQRFLLRLKHKNSVHGLSYISTYCTGHAPVKG